jgi:transposase InsO family protein
VAKAPDERWASDLCRVWTGRDGWASLALVIDCYSRELLGWHLSRSGRSKTAEAALEQALIAGTAVGQGRGLPRDALDYCYPREIFRSRCSCLSAARLAALFMGTPSLPTEVVPVF